ncbi:hypothetical protein MMC10_000077 [Thelotrema lepadinum]|nr:hypothetical protein [Thelotrema lepadinum]
MPRAIVVDLTSLSDSDGAQETRTDFNGTVQSERQDAPSIQERLSPRKRASQPSQYSPSSPLRTRGSPNKPRQYRHGDISWTTGDLGQKSRWHVTPKEGREVDMAQDLGRWNGRGIHASPNRQSANGKGTSTKGKILARKDARRSNLVDDLLRSGSGDDTDSDLDPPVRASNSLGIVRAIPSIQGSSPSSRGLSSMTQALNSTSSSFYRPVYKRARLAQTSASETGRHDARFVTRRDPSASDSFQPSQHGITSKRRGRPPGSRNKTKALNDLLSLRPATVKETPISATSDFSVYQPPLIHYSWSNQNLSRASLLRHRELGGCPGLGPRNIQDNLRQAVTDQQLSPWKGWDGASKDVITGAWSPDGTHFAVGASTDLDPLNLRYNRNNNLLWGNTERGFLSELPDHCLPREVPLDMTSNSQGNDTYNTLDSRVFTTVSSICFNARGDHMYTSSYDKKVKIWKVQENDVSPRCVADLVHGARVELLDGREGNGCHLLATAQHESTEAISVFGISSDNPGEVTPRSCFTSERAERMSCFPTALRWGTASSHTEQLLLAGFAENKNDDFQRDRQGDLLLWDMVKIMPYARLTPAAQCVFDLAWHPRLPIMAAATTPSPLLSNRQTKSVIKTWSPLESGSRIMEFECPALDVNEICFHPSDQHYLCAACTNGCAYLWDVRRPDDILQVLRHGRGIEEIDRDRSIEDQDTGMRFMSWGLNGSHLFTGSSDGLIKQWNPFVAEEDTLIRDVVTFDSGIMAGSFSPDYSELLVGLCKGSVQVLSSAPPSEAEGTVSSFSFRPAP